jgi:hypothetical protein
MAGEPGNRGRDPPETLPVYGEKGFCAIRIAGMTRRIESRNISELCDFISDAEIAWIDYVVEDVEHEVLATATTLGFSDLLTRNLLLRHLGCPDAPLWR